MKRILVAAAAFGALASAAFAQNNATSSNTQVAQAPPPAPMMWGHDWNGPYVGINGGGGWNDTHFNYTLGGAPLRSHGSGALAGGTAGINWQFDRHWLVGVEGDGDWTDISSKTACPNPAFSCNTFLQDFATLRVRGGYAWDRLLFYGTGGAAISDIHDSTIHLSGVATPPSGTPSNGSTNTNIGWVGGGGVEYALWSRLSVKAEALYYDFGNMNYAVDTGLFHRSNEHGILARVGLNWNFNRPPAPLPPAVVPAAAPAPPPPPMARTFLVFFDFDRYNLTPDARRVIDAAAGVYKAGGHPRIDVSGYTDLAGTQAYNLRLSQRRADAVASYLMKQGVPRNAMDVKWFGKEHPRVPTADGVREPQNRRVEIMMP